MGNMQLSTLCIFTKKIREVYHGANRFRGGIPEESLYRYKYNSKNLSTGTVVFGALLAVAVSPRRVSRSRGSSYVVRLTLHCLQHPRQRANSYFASGQHSLVCDCDSSTSRYYLEGADE